MATHLSESSVNSLLRLINHADNTGSYNEKVDLLKKSGILVGGNEYSSVVNKATVINTDEISILKAAGLTDTLSMLASLLTRTREKLKETVWAFDTRLFSAAAKEYLITGRKGPLAIVSQPFHSRIFGEALKSALSEWVAERPNKAPELYRLSGDIQAGKLSPYFGMAKAIEIDPATRPEIQNQIRDALATIQDLGIEPLEIANYTSDKLTAFLVDGTYKFTYILFPTTLLTNGATGTGTSVISSNYDSYTKQLDKKAMINTFLTQPPQPSQIALQSFDITSTFMVMETYGSSLVGKFRIDGNKLQIKDYGFDATTGTFTNFQSVYLKTEIGLIVSNINSDTDQLHSVFYYAIVPSADLVAPPQRN